MADLLGNHRDVFRSDVHSDQYLPEKNVPLLIHLESYCGGVVNDESLVGASSSSDIAPQSIQR